MHTSDFLFSLAYIHKIYIYAIYFFSSKTLFVRTSVEKINTSVFSSWSPLGFSNQSYSFMFFVWFFCLSVQRVTLQKKKIWKILQSIWIFTVLFAISLGFFNILLLYQDSNTDCKWEHPTEASENRDSLEVHLGRIEERPAETRTALRTWFWTKMSIEDIGYPCYPFVVVV